MNSLKINQVMLFCDSVRLQMQGHADFHNLNWTQAGL